jgi:tRNA threonylcarbamoyl adenosine modification protein YjeE
VILSETELIRWGEQVGRQVSPPLFVGLRGGLGAGKSVLARAIARGAGVEETMPSPTFNLVFRYATPQGNGVVHMDLYRLRRSDELWELGWEELGAEDEIVLVEWPERAGELLPSDRWDVELSMPREGGDVREVRVTRVGDPPHLPGFPMAVSGRGGGG